MGYVSLALTLWVITSILLGRRTLTKNGFDSNTARNIALNIALHLAYAIPIALLNLYVMLMMAF